MQALCFYLVLLSVIRIVCLYSRSRLLSVQHLTRAHHWHGDDGGAKSYEAHDRRDLVLVAV